MVIDSCCWFLDWISNHYLSCRVFNQRLNTNRYSCFLILQVLAEDIFNQLIWEIYSIKIDEKGLQFVKNVSDNDLIIYYFFNKVVVGIEWAPKEKTLFSAIVITQQKWASLSFFLPWSYSVQIYMTGMIERQTTMIFKAKIITFFVSLLKLVLLNNIFWV